ncbi:hypothetical protein [Paenibacillus amylolyticus]|uniref:hypothetical protein n=1 Tax=Paenibacillus amylolyticus TaxID=1451 RepID=UPI00117C1BD8|nr:hypothetical protein [Paenibacillus amylolyticus]
MELKKFEESEVWDIIERNHDSVIIIDDRIASKGFYEVHDVDFGLDGIMYTCTYRKHVSEHIKDRDIIYMPRALEEQPHSINTEEEAHFIWRELMKKEITHISKEEISLIVDLQYKYLVSIGLVD